MSAPVIMFLVIIIVVIMTLLIILRSNNLAAKENQAAAMNRINIKIGESTAVTFRQLVNDQLEIEVLENGEKKTFSTENPNNDNPPLPDEDDIFNDDEAEQELNRIREASFSVVSSSEGRSKAIKAQIAEMVNTEANAKIALLLQKQKDNFQNDDAEDSDDNQGSGGGINKALKPEPNKVTPNADSQSPQEIFFGPDSEYPSNSAPEEPPQKSEEQHIKTEAEKKADDDFNSFFAGEEQQKQDQENFSKKHPYLPRN